jgi:hypothetical protein
MKMLIALLTLLTLAAAGRANTDTPLLVEPAEVIGTDGTTRVTIASSDRLDFSTHEAHFLRGEVMFENVEGIARLVVRGEFASNRHRTMEPVFVANPNNEVTGSSDWLRFVSIVQPIGGKEKPTRIHLEVTMPGKGVVRVRDVVLEARNRLAWWSSRTSGLIGAAVGTSVGILGAVIGVLGPRGKGRRITIIGFALGMTVGAACLLVGLVALFSRQPYAVWYPLVLTGVLLCVTLPVIAMVIRKAQTQQELNRMRAADMG